MTTGNESVTTTGTSTTETTTTAATETQTPAWAAELPDDLKSMVATKGYKTASDLATAYVHAERALGVDKIAVPKDGQWDPTARQKLGIPDTVEGYKITRPEMPKDSGITYDEKFEKGMLPIAHQLGLTPGQVNGLIKAASDYRLGEITGSAQAQATALAEAQAAMKAEFGTTYEAKMSAAQRAVHHFGGQALIDHLNASGMGNHPELIKAFAKIGASLGEDVIKTGNGAGGITPAEALAEFSKLQASEEYKSRNHPMHEEAVKKGQRLMQMAYPEQAA